MRRDRSTTASPREEEEVEVMVVAIMEELQVDTARTTATAVQRESTGELEKRRN